MRNMSKHNSEKCSEPDPESNSLPEYNIKTSYKQDKPIGPSGDYEFSHNTKYSFDMKKNAPQNHEGGDELYSLKNDFLKNLNIIRKQLNMVEINSDSSKQNTPRIHSAPKSPKVLQLGEYKKINSDVNRNAKAIYEIKEETLQKMVPNKWSVNLGQNVTTTTTDVNSKQQYLEMNYDPPKKKLCYRIKTPVLTENSDAHIELPYRMKVGMDLDVLKKKSRHYLSSACTQYYSSDTVDPTSWSLLDIDKNIDFTQIEIDSSCANVVSDSNNTSKVNLLSPNTSSKHVHLIPNVIVKNDNSDAESQNSLFSSRVSNNSIYSQSEYKLNCDDSLDDQIIEPQKISEEIFKISLQEEHDAISNDSSSNISRRTATIKLSGDNCLHHSGRVSSNNSLSKSEKCVIFSPIKDEDFQISLKLLSPKNNSQTITSSDDEKEFSDATERKSLWEKNEDYSNLNTPDSEDILSKSTIKTHTTILENSMPQVEEDEVEEEGDEQEDEDEEKDHVLNSEELIHIFRNSAAIASKQIINKINRNISSCSCSISEIKTDVHSVKSNSIKLNTSHSTVLEDKNSVVIPNEPHVTSSIEIPKLYSSKPKFPAIAYIASCFKISVEENEKHSDIKSEKSEHSVLSREASPKPTIKDPDAVPTNYIEAVQQLLENDFSNHSETNKNLSVVNGKSYDLRSRQSVHMEFYEVVKSRSISPCNQSLGEPEKLACEENEVFVEPIFNEDGGGDASNAGEDVVNNDEKEHVDDDEDSTGDHLCKCLCFSYLFS